nr:hypothetical protein [Pseudomonas syringae pv. actinidiae]
MPDPLRTPKEQLLAWRAVNWPPKGMRKLGGLPIYIGEHEAVSALSDSLGSVMAKLSEHISDTGNARTPRWMAVPKIEYLVERLNIVETSAKASRRFESVQDIEARCGHLLGDGAEVLQQWFSSSGEGAEVVAHKAFTDLRAYVFCKSETSPKRHRFYESGLIIAPIPDTELLIQDNRGIVRSKRSDRLKNPVATSSGGWEIYV